jgi:hypothetical protein
MLNTYIRFVCKTYPWSDASTIRQRLYLFCFYRDDWLTVHRSIILVDLQLDAQNSYLFIYNIFIKIFYMFRALPCSSSGGLRRKCIYAASGNAVSAGDFHGDIFVSCAVPPGNVSWILFQDGRSSNLRLRRGVGQASHTRNNPHVKWTGVY